MKPNHQAAATADLEADRLDLVGTFIWQERERIRAAAARQNVTGAATVVQCRLRGASMAGAIPQGSRIRITFSHAPHSVGDIVAFMIGERIVVHRIVHRARRHLITRGDAMLLPDPPIDAVAVLGHVNEIDSGSGWRQPGAQTRPPRRDRLLATAVLMASGLLLKIDADLTRRFIEWIDAADHRFAWTRRILLY
jgi:hypothetical protein